LVNLLLKLQYPSNNIHLTGLLIKETYRGLSIMKIRHAKISSFI
jgi:hypothetical protein